MVAGPAVGCSCQFSPRGRGHLGLASAHCRVPPASETFAPPIHLLRGLSGVGPVAPFLDPFLGSAGAAVCPGAVPSLPHPHIALAIVYPALFFANWSLWTY